MSDLDLDASEYGEDELPARGGDWVGSGDPLIQIAQVKRVYRDNDWPGHENEGFLADLYIYDIKGNKIGRESESFPVKMEIGGKEIVIRGPRTFEPCCRLDYWYRIEKPEFPLEFGWTTTRQGKIVLGNKVTPRAWGKYKRRKRVALPTPIQIAKPNYDPELERRARLLTAQNLRDAAREIDDPVAKANLIAKAEQLERQTDI